MKGRLYLVPAPLDFGCDPPLPPVTDVLPLATRDTDAGGAGGNITNLADLYAVRFGLDGVHGVAMAGHHQSHIQVEVLGQGTPQFDRQSGSTGCIGSRRVMRVWG